VIQRHSLIFTLLLTLGGCSLAHKLDIQQGNIINSEQIEQLKVGMSTSQVTFLVGIPTLDRGFHPNRWNYLYYVEKSGSDPTPERLTLHFEEDKLVKIDNNYQSPS